MKTYQVSVEMTVRRLMRVKALNPQAAQSVARGYLALESEGANVLCSALEWTDGRQAYRPMPLEQIIDYRLMDDDPVEV